MSAPIVCKHLAAVFVPVIDRNRCEGKGPCVPACPFDVLAMGRLGRDERRALSLVGRIKALAHGGKQSFVVAAQRCQACGECVRVCPEQAITLKRVAVAP